MKYLKKFENHTEYEEARQNLILPNVSLCKQENEVHYNPWVETKLVVYYDIQDVSSPTTICLNIGTIKSIEVDGKETISEVSQGNVTYQFDSVGEHIIKYEFNNPTALGNGAPVFPNVTTIKRAVIADTFTSIGGNAFQGCRSLTSIDIPDSVTSIGNQAFYSCTGITSCTIGSGVTSIGNNAFSGCSSLSSVTLNSNTIVSKMYSSSSPISNIFGTQVTEYIIGDSVTSIGGNAFNGCTSLTSCTIGSGVTSIGDYAFNGCTSLTSCTIGNGVTSIGGNAFNGCTSLTSCTIGNGVTSIGDDTFFTCRGLTSIDIPNSVTNIGDRVFTYCTSLTSVTIGNGVTSIGVASFGGCSGLTNIRSYAITAPTIQSDTFSNIKMGGTLTVPSGSTGYDVWMGTSDYYLGKYGWTKVEQ